MTTIPGRNADAQIGRPVSMTGVSLAVEASGDQPDEAGVVVQTVVRARLVDANTAAAAFYRAQLLGPAGVGPARYLTSRGLGHVMGEQSVWRVGYAAPGWTALLEHLHAAGFTGEEALAAGLARQTRRGSLIDTFRDRVMCPVREETGAVAGFIGRAAPDAGPDVPKYLNTPETALYRKGKCLYGLAEQRDAFLAAARPVLVEGPMDVLAVAATGSSTSIPSPAVAPCGTALTAAQLDLLGRTAARELGVLVAFDADDAGRWAAVRAHGLLTGYGGPAHVIVLPTGEDPGDVLQRHGIDALRAVLTGPTDAVPLADLAVDERLARWPVAPAFPEHRVQALRSVALLVATLPPEQVARQVTRVAARLALGHAAVTEAVTDVLSDTRVRGARGGPSGIRAGPHRLHLQAVRLSTDPVRDRPNREPQTGR